MPQPKKNFFEDHSPFYRALLKAMEAAGWIIAINGIYALSSYLANHSTINWQELGIFAGAQAALALALAISKYFKASRQPMLGEAIDQAVAEIQKRRPELQPRLPEETEAGLRLEQRTWRPIGDDWSKRRPTDGG